MRSIFQLSVLFMVLISLSSCEKKGTEYTPEKMVYFHCQFPDNESNLNRKWGKELSLLQDNNDTLHLTLRYNSASKINIILNRDNQDTIFKGKVFKYKRLYYFSNQWGDSAYNLFTVKIYHNKIYRLNGEAMQMYTLFNLMESDTIHPVKSLRDTTIGKFHYALRPDKKLLSLFYKSIIDSFPSMSILNEKTDIEHSEIILLTKYRIRK